jgi:hypothetical protein
VAEQEKRHCKTCGGEIRTDGRCNCWALLADALQQYLGMDFDEAAMEAAQLWDEVDDDYRERVWSGEWPAEHPGVPFYPVAGGPAEVTPFPGQVFGQWHFDPVARKWHAKIGMNRWVSVDGDLDDRPRFTPLQAAGIP